MSALWRGSRATRWRIGSGLVLFVYALLHFLNIGFGLISPEAMEEFQDARQLISRSVLGTLLIYGAFTVHVTVALWRVALRGTLRMPLAEAAQLVFGLLIPVYLIIHVTFTRVAHWREGVHDEFGYLIGLIWNTQSGWEQALLLLLVWTHACIGLHMWLRAEAWWRRWLPALTGLAALVPAFALAGFVTEGRRLAIALADPATAAALRAEWNFFDAAAFARLLVISQWALYIYLALLAGAAAVYAVRKLLSRTRSVTIQYVDGPKVRAQQGLTLLEMSRASGVPHTSLCGGRGRCTTCRVVVEEGREHLHPPDEAEALSLRKVGAAPNVRLACQMRPTHPATVFRVFLPDGKRGRAHASQGQERRLALLFLDMRGFTARTTGQLPYDVVFLLNRFFDAIVPAIVHAGGTVDKYLGDGLLAVFEAETEAMSARAGLRAAAGIGAALEAFNAALQDEGGTPVRIGIGLHLGELVLGEIGAAGNAPRTIIGDTVNTASRIEGATKELGVELAVSQAVLDAAGVETAGVDLTTLELRGVVGQVHVLPLKHATGITAIAGPAAG